MKALLTVTSLTLAMVLGARAQSADHLNLQFHGYATQTFVFTNQNSWNTTGSEDGSFSWSEGVVNATALPKPKLRVGAQGRFFLLGDYGRTVTLDWAQADYKFSETAGVRAGKVKTPAGLLNETQDIDPAHVWVLLPQSVYPIASRNSILAHYGGVFYGRRALGEKGGKLEYRAFLGERIISGSDAYLQQLRDAGLAFPNGVRGKTFGGTVHWLTPVRGLMVGGSEESGLLSGAATAHLGTVTGDLKATEFRQTFYFATYEHRRLTVAAEYSRLSSSLALTLKIPNYPVVAILTDQRPWYVMSTYRLPGRWTGGVYYSSIIDHKIALGIPRYEKDWAVAARYDFNSSFYAKAEQHWIDGAHVGFSADDNPNLQPTTRMTLIKAGVSF